MTMDHYLHDVRDEFRKYKGMAEKAIEQVSDEDFFRLLDDEANSIALVVKHMAGNMRSRWRDFLTSDGEKPDRYRDSEFIIDKDDTKASLMLRWEKGWNLLFGAIEPLSPNELSKTIYIRAEPHTILQAINRQLTHYAYHVGQIVLLAKHFAGDKWQSLSIPKGKSEEFNVYRFGQVKRHDNS